VLALARLAQRLFLQAAQALAPLQFGDHVGDAFAPADRKVRDISDPDPCARFGPRSRPGGFVTRLVTNHYVPQAEGVAPQRR